MSKRWRIAAIAAAAVLLLYALLGFVAVPLLVKWQVPRLAASQLQRQGSVGDVRFNPFTLRLVADRLALAETDGRPLASIERLVAQGDWRSPVRRAWSLRELRIEGPALLVSVDQEGRSNLGALLDKGQPTQQGEAGANRGEVPRFVAENVEVVRGRVDIDDRQAGYGEQVTPIDLHLSRFSTLPQDVEGHEVTAEIASGGRLRWRGEVTVNPIGARGEITLESLNLRPVSAYVRKVLHMTVTEGHLDAKLPYRVAVEGGKLQAQLSGAEVAITDIAAVRPDVKGPFMAFKQIRLSGLSGDLAERALAIETFRAAEGRLLVQRDSKGEIDLVTLTSLRGHHADADPPRDSAPSPSWKVAAKQVQVEQVALKLSDSAAQPPVNWAAERVGVALQLEAQGTADGPKVALRNVSLDAQGLSVQQGQARPIQLERVTVANGTVDHGAKRAEIGRLAVEGGKVRVVRDESGAIDLKNLVGEAPEQEQKAGKSDWKALARQVVANGLTFDIEDRQAGLRTQLQDVKLRAEGAGTDLSQPVRVEAGLRMQEGGELALRGVVVPAAPSIVADIEMRGLPLAMAQPLLQRHVRLKIAGGTADAQGRLEAALTRDGAPKVRFAGGGEVSRLRLNESDGTPFASWTALSARRMTADLNGVDIPELRLVGSDASLTIQPDRSINAARLRAAPAPSAARQAPAKAAAPQQPFAVHIGALRLQNGKLKFTDLSLQPQFSAEIHDLNGAITGLSTRADTRSQVTLDGKVDEYGQARIRGALNLLALVQDTDVNVVFRNIDMVKQSPYAIRFAGYRIAKGRMSLDLRYQIRDSQLAGDNKIVIDELTLGERVESPEATKLPVALAINILKDDQGRIDLGLPVSGNLADPQFSYGALFAKALGSLVTKVITAPFRAFAGGGSEKLEAIEFDAGSARVLPPEQEKLARVAEVLKKREQFKLLVPAGYAQDADAGALRAQAVHRELAQRAGLAKEAAGPPNLGDRSMRTAIRELYVQRFGESEMGKARMAAQGSPSTMGASAGGSGKAPQLGVFQQIGRAMQGEPQVADTSAFYEDLLKRLEQQQSLAPDALAQLGQQRAQAVTTALEQAGVARERVATSPAAAVAPTDQRMVPLKLSLDLR